MKEYTWYLTPEREKIFILRALERNRYLVVIPREKQIRITFLSPREVFLEYTPKGNEIYRLIQTVFEDNWWKVLGWEK